MKEFAPLWPAALVALMLLMFVGVAAFARRGESLGPWVLGLMIAATAALILEAGSSHRVTAHLVGWLDANIPSYRGMRDAGKWASLVALAYSQLAALGALTIVERLRNHATSTWRAEWAGSTAAALLLAIPFYYGNGLLFGMHGEIKPSQYPPGWYAADQFLLSDPNAGRTLFLPWHEYLGLSFVRNQNAAIACPAPAFFSKPVLVSTDPELFGKPPPTDPVQVAVSNLVKASDQGHWAPVLAAMNVKYILLAREVDWESYTYLLSHEGLVEVADYGSIILFRNTLVP
jgi:hypothetical protein